MPQLALTNTRYFLKMEKLIPSVICAAFYLTCCLFSLSALASDESVDDANQQTFKTLQTIAKNGNATAMRMIASMYEQGDGVAKDLNEAIKWYRKAAELEDDVAQFYLGYLYYQAIGLPKDYHQAFIWFEKAAQQGNADFQYNLGNLYRYGEGTSVNFKSALQWYLLAAQQDQSNAQFDLASLFSEGVLVTKDLSEAYFWYSLASEQMDATDELKALTNSMSEAQINSAKQKSQQWIDKNRLNID